MKTLVYCTAFAATPDTWTYRYRRWVDALKASRLRFDQILIVDDGSAYLPSWPDAEIVRESEGRTAENLDSAAPLILYHFDSNLGRKTIYNFPGWHRSFAFGAIYAEAHGFTKVLHIESDAYLTSARGQDYFDAIDEGWVVVWSEKYKFPEIAIQAIAGTQVGKLAEMARRPYSAMIEECHEWAFPFTHIERGLIGDRYGETAEGIPRDADYASQIPPTREGSFYWWLQARGASAAAPQEEALLRADDQPSESPNAYTGSSFAIDFREGGNGEDHATTGWSHVEPYCRWMIGAESYVTLPAFSAGRQRSLTVRVMPCVDPTGLSQQRLIIALNDRILGRYEVYQETIIGCDLPAGLLRSDAENELYLIHPDAISPAALGKNGDERPLALAMLDLAIAETRAAEG